MQTDANTAHADFIGAITRGLLAGLALCPDESGTRRNSYEQTLAFCVMAFQPRDMPEYTVANHCLRFHYVLDDAIDDMLNEPDNLVRRKLRPGVNTTGRISLGHGREYQRLRRRKPHEIIAPFAAACAQTDDAPRPDRDQPAPEAKTQPEPTAAAKFGLNSADIMAASKILAARFAAETAQATAGAATAGAAATNTGTAPVPPAMPGLWAGPGAPSATRLAQHSDRTTTPRPAPPAIRAVPEPAASPKPANRAQRRLAMKLERTKARRTAAIAAKSVAKGTASAGE